MILNSNFHVTCAIKLITPQGNFFSTSNKHKLPPKVNFRFIKTMDIPVLRTIYQKNRMTGNIWG